MRNGWAVTGDVGRGHHLHGSMSSREELRRVLKTVEIHKTVARRKGGSEEVSPKAIRVCQPGEGHGLVVEPRAA